MHDDLSTCTCIGCTPELWLGHMESQVIARADTRRLDDPWPVDTCDGYVSAGPFSCICERCTEASEPSQPRISLEATHRPFWRINALWSRLTHR